MTTRRLVGDTGSTTGSIIRCSGGALVLVNMQPQKKAARSDVSKRAAG